MWNEPKNMRKCSTLFETKSPFIWGEYKSPNPTKKVNQKANQQQQQHDTDVNEVTEKDSRNEEEVIITSVSTYAGAANLKRRNIQSTTQGSTHIG